MLDAVDQVVGVSIERIERLLVPWGLPVPFSPRRGEAGAQTGGSRLGGRNGVQPTPLSLQTRLAVVAIRTVSPLERSRSLWLPAFKQAALRAANRTREKAKQAAAAVLHLRRYRKTTSDLVVKHPRLLTAIHTPTARTSPSKATRH
jgi:hypothetical protein